MQSKKETKKQMIQNYKMDKVLNEKGRINKEMKGKSGKNFL